MEELQVSDYILILWQRRKMLCSLVLGAFLLIVLFAANWSNYRAIATVEIAQAEIPDSVAAPAGMNAGNMLETLADLRISRLQQKVLSTGSLVEIITKFNLYAHARETTPIAEIAEQMRKKIKIELISSSLANPASAQKAGADQLAAIAFTLSFDYSDPLLTQQVTNELVSRFLDEDLKERRTQSKETSAFLESQIKQMEESLKDQEKQLAEYREAHGDTRPEALAFNQQANLSAQMALQNLETQISTNMGMQGTLRGQLASVDPYSRVLAEGQLLTTPTVQLKTLKSNYAALTAKYGARHPDVLKAKRQIEALEAETGDTSRASALQATLTDVNARLETALKTYGPANPEIISLRNQQAKIEAQLQDELAKRHTQDLIKNDADNPAYLQIVAQLKATEDQYKGLLRQRAELQAQQSKFQRAVIQNPAAEQKLADLTRDYDNARAAYRDLKAKKLAADMTATIDEDRSGQKLVVINPPELPTSTQPKRLLFVIGGAFLSLAFGIGTVISVQIMRQTIAGPRHLAALAGAPPIVIVPHLTSSDERRRHKELRLRYIGGAAVAAIVLLTLVSNFFMPLDVLWSVLARRLGLS